VVRRTSVFRSLASVVGLGLLVSMVAVGPASAAPPGGNVKPLQIAATGLTGFGTFSISGGQTIPMTVVVSNTGKNTINDIHLNVGQDGDPTTAANGDANPPIALPTGVTASAVPSNPAIVCTPGAILSCDIGTLRARTSVSFNVVISTAEVASAIAQFGTKATVTGAEGGNDSGGNQDSFSIEGQLAVSAFSCESVTVYKPGADKTVTTCDLDDARNANGQSAIVILPSGRSVATVKENQGAACPFTTCLGDEVEADITGDTTSETVIWTVVIDLTAEGLSVPNPQKIVAWHKGDNASDPVQTFELSKKNACKTATQQLCGSASIATVDGHQILTITIQTGGNGKSRFT